MELTLGEWIMFAEKNGMIVTMNDIDVLPLNSTVELAELEYTRFLFTHQEALDEAKITKGVFYEPINFFQTTTFKKTGPVSDYEVGKSYPKVTGIYQYGVGSFQERILVATNLKTGHLESGGSGDGYTRYVFVDKLRTKNLPSVCWKSYRE